MNRLAQFFDFSSAQLRFLVGMAGLATVLAVVLLVRTVAVPTEHAPALSLQLSEPSGRFSGLVQLDPNTAPADSLELLPGIGKVLADRIVEYRQHHRFVRPVDITEVNGIGPKLFERLRPYLRIGQP